MHDFSQCSKLLTKILIQDRLNPTTLPPISIEVDLLTLQVFGSTPQDTVTKNKSFCLPIALSSEHKFVKLKRPLPAPRFSKRRTKTFMDKDKKGSPWGYKKNTKNRDCKSKSPNEKLCDTAADSFYFPVYNEGEINLIREIEKEFEEGLL